MGLLSQATPSVFGPLHVVAPAKRGSTEVVLFLHGFRSSWTVWKPVMLAMDKAGYLAGRDRIAVDLPGFGQSLNQLDHLDAAVIGAELLRIVGELGYERIRLVGHSMGGFLTLDMASRFPERIVSVHVVAGSYFRLIRLSNQPLLGWPRNPLMGAFYWYERLFDRNPTNRRVFRYASRNGRGYDARARWGALQQPVYAVFGDRDPLVSPRDAREFSDILPKAHVTSLARAGHMVVAQYPQAVAKALFGGID